MAMQTYEFLVAPRAVPGKPSQPLIKIRISAESQYAARQQAESIYGPNCERSPIIPKK